MSKKSQTKIMIIVIQRQFLKDAQHRHQQMQTNMTSSTGQNEAACSTLSTELEDMLESKSTSIQSLADYPVIGRAFIKANSTLPSRTAAERLFSAAGMILNSR